MSLPTAPGGPSRRVGRGAGLLLAGLVGLAGLAVGPPSDVVDAPRRDMGGASWLHVRAEGAKTHVDRGGCAPPVQPELDDLADATALAVRLSTACSAMAGGIDAAPWRGGPEPGAAPGAFVALHDLDGDGHRDVAVITAPTGAFDEQAVDVRSGRDGRLLWSHQAPGQVVAVSPAAGTDGTGGVVVSRLVQPRVDALSTSAMAHGLEVRALDASGRQRWLHRAIGAAAWTTGTNAEVDVTWVGAVADLAGDGADDVAVARARFVTVLGNPVYLFAVDVVDGTTGEIAGTATIDGTAFPWMDLIGDVDGDGRADLALNMPEEPAETDIELWRGDGVRLWDVPLPKAFIASVTSVGDFTGDGLDDLVATGATFDEGWVIGLAGNTGEKRFRLDAELFASVFAPGDLDGDGLAEIGIADVDPFTPLFEPGAPIELRHRIADASGEVRHEVVDALGLHGSATLAAFGRGDATLSVAVASAGDVDGDGTVDRWFEVAASHDSDGTEQVTGSAGVRRGDDLALVRALEPFVTSPLRGSVDGFGDDLRVDRRDGDRQVVTVEDGRTGAKLATLDAPGGGLRIALRGVDLDGRGPDEILATVLDQEFRTVAGGVLVAPDLRPSWWLGSPA